jgi:hypothetical protein
MRRYSSAESLKWSALGEAKPKLVEHAPGRSKRRKAVLREAGKIMEMRLVHVHTRNGFEEALLVE